MKYFLPALMMLMFAACSEVKPLVDYNPQTDFSTYRTFSVCEFNDDAKTARNDFDTPENRNIIKQVLGEKMKALGYIEDETGPDMLVSYDLKFEKEEITYTTCRETGDYEFWPECRVEQYPYIEGTLILTIIDNAFDQVVWVGSMEDVWSDIPEKRFKSHMRTFVDALFYDFPKPEKEMTN